MSMKEEIFKSPYSKRWESIRGLSGGLEVFTDPQDIKDTEFSDCLNVTFDKGYPTPRKGSQMKWAKPAGEANTFLNLFSAHASDGSNYAIAVYAPNFYFRDESNDQWIRINQTYTPSTTYKTLPYGYINWQAGIGSDILYAGNGTEDCIKWQIGYGTLQNSTLVGDTTLTLNDASQFPSTGGNIVIKPSGGSAIYKTYTSKTGNVLTLSGTIGTSLSSGSGITFQIADATNVAKGKILTKYQGRLIVANQLHGECSVFGSEVGNAENFVVDINYTDPFSEVITDGTGGLTGADSFGEYLILEKADSIYKLKIDPETTAAADGTTTTVRTITAVPVFTDVSSGPVQPWARIKKSNVLYYATKTEGILSVDPTISGSQTSVEDKIMSQPIQPLVTSLDFTNSRTAAFNQKLLWTAKFNTNSDTIIVYDLLRKVWTKFSGWLVRDWMLYNDNLYFGSFADGNIYQAFTDQKTDGNNYYDAYVLSKRWDLTMPSLPKTTSKVFLSGYISATESLRFDVILTTGDKIVTIPYMIKGNSVFTVATIPRAIAMWMIGLFTVGMSDYSVTSTLGIFRVYLAIPSRYGFFTIQVKVYSQVNGTDWGLTGLGFPPLVENQEVKAPQMMVQGSIVDPTNPDVLPTVTVKNTSTFNETVIVNGSQVILAPGQSNIWSYSGKVFTWSYDSQAGYMVPDTITGGGNYLFTLFNSTSVPGTVEARGGIIS